MFRRYVPGLFDTNNLAQPALSTGRTQEIRFGRMDCEADRPQIGLDLHNKIRENQ